MTQTHIEGLILDNYNFIRLRLNVLGDVMWVWSQHQRSSLRS